MVINLERRGEYYMAWHQDARDIKEVVPNRTLFKTAGADTIGIPVHLLEEIVHVLNKAGISVKINPNSVYNASAP